MNNRLVILGNSIRSNYIIPKHNIVGEVLIPAMQGASKIQIGAGYFSSHSLVQIAPGLAEAISNPDCNIKLLLNPEISEEDHEAIKNGLLHPKEAIRRFLNLCENEYANKVTAITKHTLECLSYLLAEEKLTIKYVLMPKGIYHKKIWIFTNDDCTLAVHGSGNVTQRGLFVNGEQMTVDRPWMDGPSAEERVSDIVTDWNTQWNREDKYSITVDALEAIPFLSKYYKINNKPTSKELYKEWNKIFISTNVTNNTKKITPDRLKIPKYLVWDSGRYKHQGESIKKLEANNWSGILSICTGGGKTITALISASLLQEQMDSCLLLIIAVPSKPLISQWTKDIETFGVKPLVLGQIQKRKRAAVLNELKMKMSSIKDSTVVILTSITLLIDDHYLRHLLEYKSGNARTMLIADEVHNFGTKRVLHALPFFDYRLGLSATPIRQYDKEGTAGLLEYFNNIVDEFTIRDAIASGALCHYDYHLIEVKLEELEYDRYIELSEDISKYGYELSDDSIENKRVEKLLFRRRALLEQANGKISSLKQLIHDIGIEQIENCLIYASSKKSEVIEYRQIEKINELLSDIDVRSHEITYKETSSTQSSEILDYFEKGIYQVLTSMKVLDEGVNIPQIRTAVILASSSVEREWIQRRGRILRPYPGKKRAILYDFLVLPPKLTTKSSKILEGELLRADEFAKDADNEFSNFGPRKIIDKWQIELLNLER